MPVPPSIGRYAVERPLGSGAFAVVWLGHDRDLDDRVAIKVLSENWTHQMDIRDRFLQEAKVLRRARSERVVQVFDIGELADGRPYFVMSYADRGSLADRADRTGVATALRHGADIALGVADLHRVGIMHRDIKPSNVLFRSDGGGVDRLVIADLGLSKQLSEASGFTLAAGTPGFMAPEQSDGLGLDHRVDVYGIGATVYHLLTRVKPAAGAVAPPSESRPGLPEGTDEVLLRALATDPGDRWPTALELAKELAALAAARPKSLVPPPASPPRPATPAGEGSPRLPGESPAAAPLLELPGQGSSRLPGESPAAAPPLASDGRGGPRLPGDSQALPPGAPAGQGSPQLPGEPDATQTMPRVRPGEWSPPLPGESPAAAAPLASAGRGSPRLPGEPPVAAPQGPPRPDPVADAEITTRIPTIPGTPHTPPRKSRRGWWLAGAGVLLAAAAATALILRPWQPTTTPDHVEVSDDRGRVHLTVPTTWAGERQGGGWRPADIGAADDETGPAVAVAEDIDRWRDHQDRTPGVFVGLSGDADVPGLALALRHDGCRAGEATRRAGALSGQVVRWTCPNDVTFDEAGLRTEGGTSVYVQIKQSTRDPDRADEILAGIRII